MIEFILKGSIRVLWCVCIGIVLNGCLNDSRNGNGIKNIQNNCKKPGMLSVRERSYKDFKEFIKKERSSERGQGMKFEEFDQGHIAGVNNINIGGGNCFGYTRKFLNPNIDDKNLFDGDLKLVIIPQNLDSVFEASNPNVAHALQNSSIYNPNQPFLDDGLMEKSGGKIRDVDGFIESLKGSSGGSVTLVFDDGNSHIIGAKYFAPSNEVIIFDPNYAKLTVRKERAGDVLANLIRLGYQGYENEARIWVSKVEDVFQVFDEINPKNKSNCVIL